MRKPAGEKLRLYAHAGMPPEAMLSQTVGTQALVMSFEDGFKLAMVAILFGLVLLFIMKKPKSTVPPPDAH